MDKKVIETLIENGLDAADNFYGTATDRIIEKMEQKEANITKDKEVAGKAAEKIAEMIYLVNDAVTDRIAGSLNGLKYVLVHKVMS